MFRIILFFFTNLAVVILVGIIFSLMGFNISGVFSLMIVSLIVGFSGAIISLFMSKSIALFAVGGVIIRRPCNALEVWLLDIVNKQSKVMGVIAPKVAIYVSSDMNAFATGARRNSALIAISSSLLNGMSRDEVEAVVAHEMCHISNGDMVTMTLIQGIVNTFVVFVSRILSQLFSSFFYSARDEDNNYDTNKSICFVLTILLELFFGVFASIIVLWFSRSREFYADAGSAKLVGCDKMINALQRLKSGDILHREVACDNQYLASLFINGKSYAMSLNKIVLFFNELFMSHPPLDKRIAALRSGAYLKKISVFL